MPQHYLQQCRAALDQQGLTFRRKLAKAGKIFWKGSIVVTDWPDPVKQRVAAMLKRLIDAGVVGSDSLHVDESTARSLCADLRSVVSDFRRALQPPRAPSIEAQASRSGGFPIAG